MRILVCDDEKMICDSVGVMIRNYAIKEDLKDIELVTYYSGEDLLKDRGDKDIVFLDVKLGEGADGCSVAQTLKKRNSKTIIFLLTGYREYTDDAFRIGVFRFIDKPLKEERIHQNLKEALDLYYTACGKVNVEEKNAVYTKYISDVIFVQTYGRGSQVHTTEGKYISSHNMSYWQKALKDGCFVSTHRGYLVNMNYILNYDDGNICFRGYEEKAFLATRKAKKFKKQYSDFINSMNK